MAQPGAYRDGMQCPRCGSNWLPQYGHSRGKQTYRCGHCQYHFVPGTERPHQPEPIKARDAAMYTEGNSMSACGQVLGVKEGTVYSWIKKSPLSPGVAEAAVGAAAEATPRSAPAQGHFF